MSSKRGQKCPPRLLKDFKEEERTRACAREPTPILKFEEEKARRRRRSGKPAKAKPERDDVGEFFGDLDLLDLSEKHVAHRLGQIVRAEARGLPTARWLLEAYVKTDPADFRAGRIPDANLRMVFLRRPFGGSIRPNPAQLSKAFAKAKAAREAREAAQQAEEVPERDPDPDPDETPPPAPTAPPPAAEKGGPARSAAERAAGAGVRHPGGGEPPPSASATGPAHGAPDEPIGARDLLDQVMAAAGVDPDDLPSDYWQRPGAERHVCGWPKRYPWMTEDDIVTAVAECQKGKAELPRGPIAFDGCMRMQAAMLARVAAELAKPPLQPIEPDARRSSRKSKGDNHVIAAMHGAARCDEPAALPAGGRCAPAVPVRERPGIARALRHPLFPPRQAEQPPTGGHA